MKNGKVIATLKTERDALNNKDANLNHFRLSFNHNTAIDIVITHLNVFQESIKNEDNIEARNWLSNKIANLIDEVK